MYPAVRLMLAYFNKILCRMKSIRLIGAVVLAAAVFSSCKKQPEPVSDSFYYDVPGTYTFTPDADNVTANIIVIGGGGGGGGGATYAGSSFGTGGGGGGGAGQVLSFENVPFETGVTYTLVVGAGGDGGNTDANGADGEASYIATSGNRLYEALPGQGGRRGNDQAGGFGGNGYPNGDDGTNGKTAQGGLANSGYGGVGGDNDAGHGLGGVGGKGTSVYLNQSGSPADPGNAGTGGYIRVEWNGEK